MHIFTKDEINTSRQFEFDFAKAVCIFGMVVVHCFKMLPLTEATYAGSLYYTFVIVLDAIFGAGTFMTCLGIGLTYTSKNQPRDYARRGLILFATGYLLNVFRYSLPACLYYITTENVAETSLFVLISFLSTDIMQFAGLSFLLFGLFKKIRLPDAGIAAAAISMSVAGSFFRFLDVGTPWTNYLLGLFVGTVDDNAVYPFFASFPLLNWFLFVVFGYLFGKLVRRCENTDRFYAVTTPVSAAVVLVYLVIAVPNQYGMMSGDEIRYFQMTTADALVILAGAVSVFGMYHFLSKLLSERAKRLITGLAVNINKTYCIHWVLLGWLSVVLWYFFEDGMPLYSVFLLAFAIYAVSTVLAECLRKRREKKKASQ